MIRFRILHARIPPTGTEPLYLLQKTVKIAASLQKNQLIMQIQSFSRVVQFSYSIIFNILFGLTFFPCHFSDLCGLT